MKRYIITWSASALVAASGHAAVSPTQIDLGPDGGGINAVSRDGRVVVGGAVFGLQQVGMRWEASNGVSFIPSLVVANGVNADGTVLVGSSTSSRATRISEFATQNLGVMPSGISSGATATDDTGAVVVGGGQVLTGGNHREPFRWTAATGMQSLGRLPGHTNADAFGINGPGTVIVGYSGNVGFRWTEASGMQSIGTIPGLGVPYARMVSDDGSVIAGSFNGFYGNQEAAFRWTSTGGMQQLLPLSGNGFADALGMSADGSMIAGTSYRSIPGGFDFRATLWSDTLGTLDLNDYLTSQGIDLTGWTLNSATISGDGHTFAGHGVFEGEYTHWIVTIPAPATGALLGLGGLLGARRRR